MELSRNLLLCTSAQAQKCILSTVNFCAHLKPVHVQDTEKQHTIVKEDRVISKSGEKLAAFKAMEAEQKKNVMHKLHSV